MLYKLVMLGEGGVGKSCVSIQMCHNYFTKEYDPTIENSYRAQVTVDGKATMLHILDTAGQEEYLAMIDQHIQAGVGFLLVYSITSKQSFEGIGRFYARICRVKELEPGDDDTIGETVPIVVIGNKCDLEKERAVSHNDGKEYAKSIRAPYFETSAKTRFNIEEAFHQLVREVNKWEAEREKEKKPSSKNSESSPKERGTPKEKKKTCVIL